MSLDSLFKKNSFLGFYIAIVIILFFILAAITPAVLAETTIEGLNTTANKGYSGTDAKTPHTGIPTGIPETIGKIVGAGLAFIGVIFLILMIYGGFLWMLARGNEQEVTKAKDLIYSAVIGLVIVLGAYAITAFVGGIFK